MHTTADPPTNLCSTGGVDTHVHFICPQQAEEALAAGLTTLVGGGTGPSTGRKGGGMDGVWFWWYLYVVGACVGGCSLLGAVMQGIGVKSDRNNATGTKATTCTPAPGQIALMLQGTDNIPMNIGLTGAWLVCFWVWIHSRSISQSQSRSQSRSRFQSVSCCAGKGNSAKPEGLEEMVEAGAIGTSLVYI